MTFERDGGSFNHNFRTLIIDPNGHLQTVFPTGGNLSDAIVDEVLKAVAVTNAAASRNPAKGKQNEARNANHKWGEEHDQARQLLLRRAGRSISCPGRRFQQLGCHLSSYATTG
jgi:hypothetical protein